MAGDVRGLVGLPNVALRQFGTPYIERAPLDLTFRERSFDLTATGRDFDLTARERSFDLTLRDRPEES